MIRVNINNYNLLQDAYITDCGTMYKALALDGDGNEIYLYWEVINYDDDYITDDMSLDCDWDKPFIK